MKGSRVQAVVQELRGEKIDIVPWDEDPARFVCNALAPGRGLPRHHRRGQNHAMELIVPDDQLSLAIGRRGQNVRLAAQLTGLEAGHQQRDPRPGDARVRQAASRASSVPEATQETLYAHGFRQAQDVAEAAPEVLAQFPGHRSDMHPGHAGSAPGSRSPTPRRSSQLEQEREEARLAEARRHPDELTQDERMARVRGVGEKTIEQLGSPATRRSRQ